MLSACGASPAARPAIAPNPIVKTTTVARTICPAEVTADLPAPVAPYAGPAVDALPEFFSWNSAHFRRESLLAGRLRDAQGQCPK
ncbi:MAG: hypothetical protein ABIO86_17060 [Sphingomonas sp.]